MHLRAYVHTLPACAVAIVRDERGRAVLERTAITADAVIAKVLREIAEYLPAARVEVR